MTDEKNLGYMSSAGMEFGDPVNAIDAPYTGVRQSTDYSVTETWWWCFHIPELKLNGEIYFWRHPNLKTMSGGVWVFKGIKKHHLQCEHFNWLNFIPEPQMTQESLFCPELNLRINIIEPLKKHEIIYQNPDSNTCLHLKTESLQLPVLRSNNAHFEQVQHIRGDLTLAGEKLKVDCVSFRDRSWGEPRPETAFAHPPTLWGVGGSSDGKRSFNFNSCDDPEKNPLVASYGLPKEAIFKTGWIFNDGDLRHIVDMSKLTHRGEDGLQASHYDIAMVDEKGDQYQLTGTILAAVMWSPWPNMAAFFGQLCEWTLDGESMYGEAQEIFFGDSLKRMIR
ncbi:MAG: hypothetical protein OXC05_04565 [Halieaceae bacterium]|nr:hypothetical protein [Halieaceae bacterium]